MAGFPIVMNLLTLAVHFIIMVGVYNYGTVGGIFAVASGFGDSNVTNGFRMALIMENNP